MIQEGKESKMITGWATGFRRGEAVVAISNGKYGHVVTVPQNFIVPAGKVPVMFDDEEECFVLIPADDLNRRFRRD